MEWLFLIERDSELVHKLCTYLFIDNKIATEDKYNTKGWKLMLCTEPMTAGKLNT